MSTKKIQILGSLTPSYDEALSDTSTNAVQNQAVATAVTELNTRIDETNEEVNAITPESIGAATSDHNHDDEYYTEAEIDSKVSDINTSIANLDNNKADVNHNHDGDYDALGAADAALNTAKSYVDEKVASAPSLDSYTKSEIDAALEGKSDATHNHDGDYDAIGSADTALDSAKEYTNTKTADLASTTVVDNKISTHNTSTSAHNDIRVLISELTTKLNNFLDVDDETTDQLSEVITLINNNKGTLDSLTISKVNVSDIIDNLTTSSTSKVLSAKQGVAIKALIDALQSELDSHTHTIADVSGLQTALDGKAASSHGTHVSYSTTAPVMDGTASVGTASTVARSDHKHPTDTSRASQTDLDALETVVAGKANSSHTHAIADVTNLQTTLNGKQATITGGASTIASSNLTASRALISNSSGKVAASDVTSTELGYLDGVTSNIQTQLDGKAASGHNHAASNITSGTLSSDRLPTVPIAKGGTGATTVADATKNLLNTAIATPGYLLTLPSSGWQGGYTSIAQLKTTLGLGSAAYTASTAYAATSHTHNYAGSSSAGGAATTALACTGNAATATKAATLSTTRYIDGVSFNGGANVTRYATCSTAAATAAKTAAITAGTFSLITGARVTVKFTYANSAASPTLNVGSTGAKAIYWHGASLVSSQYWAAGAVLDFVYNGSQWELVGVANDNNTNTDTKVTQTATTTIGAYPILASATASATATTTTTARFGSNITINPGINRILVSNGYDNNGYFDPSTFKIGVTTSTGGVGQIEMLADTNGSSIYVDGVNIINKIDNLSSPIVEESSQSTVSGTKSGYSYSYEWRWKKHSGMGKVSLWGSVNVSVPISTAYGSLYCAPIWLSIPYPSGLFLEVPFIEVMTAKTAASTIDCGVMLVTTYRGTKDKTAGFSLVRSASLATTTDFRIDIYAEGYYSK